MKTKPVIVCDLNNKKWLSLSEAILYIGMGSKDTLQKWREGIIDSRGKIKQLKFYKAGKKNIIYKRTDIDAFLEDSFRLNSA